MRTTIAPTGRRRVQRHVVEDRIHPLVREALDEPVASSLAGNKHVVEVGVVGAVIGHDGRRRSHLFQSSKAAWYAFQILSGSTFGQLLRTLQLSPQEGCADLA